MFRGIANHRVATNLKIKVSKQNFQYYIQSPEEGRRANRRNVVHIKYTSGSGQCRTLWSLNESTIVTKHEHSVWPVFRTGDVPNAKLTDHVSYSEIKIIPTVSFELRLSL